MKVKVLKIDGTESGKTVVLDEKVVLRDHLDHLEVEDLHPFISHVSCHAHSGEYAGRP